jgi:hypothetical protein
MVMTGETQIVWRKPLPVPLFPPQMPNGLNWDRNRASAVRGRQLIV